MKESLSNIFGFGILFCITAILLSGCAEPKNLLERTNAIDFAECNQKCLDYGRLHECQDVTTSFLDGNNACNCIGNGCYK